jgi:NAD(P)-dependent dehydrogenase (short-subunit alcohol dehydrogenase family)
MNNLNGKVALVTGAASKRGMGHAIAAQLADDGADVVVVDRFATPQSIWPGDEGWKGLEAVVSEIEATAGKDWQLRPT